MITPRVRILLIVLFFPALLFAQLPCSSGFQGNGVEDYITIPNTDAINLQNTRDRTIELWFKASDITTRQVIYEEGAQVNAFIIYLEGGRVYLGAFRNNGSVTADRRWFRSGSGDIEADQWNHVAFTLEDTSSPDLTLKWFLNGVEQDSQDGLQVNTHSGEISFARNGSGMRYPSSLVSNWTSSSVGGSTSETYNNTLTGSDTNNYNYAGNIALFRIWNVARTESEIDTNKSTLLTSGTDLVAYSDQDRVYYQPDGATEISLTAFVSVNSQFTTIPNTDAINLQNTRDRTVEFRFKATDMTTRQVLYEEGGNTNAITAFIEDGRFYFGVYRNNADTAANRLFFRSASGDVIFNQWYHVAITLEDTTSPDLTLKWYLDGVEQDSQDGLQVNTHSGDINIGRSGGNIRYPNDLVTGWNASSIGASSSENFNNATTSESSSNNFTGDFDLFRIWNVARTPSEIDTNKSTLLTSGTSLVAYQVGTQMNYQPDGGGSISATEDAAGIITWDGSDSNVWSTTTNWVGDAAPDATRRQKVTIPNVTNDPIITTDISVGFLTVNSGVEIVVQNGGTLQIYYGFDNNGTITVEDGGALIYHNCNSPITGSGTYNLDRDSPSYSGVKFFSYWSSPVIEADSNPGTVFPANPIIYLFDSSTSDADWVFNGTTDFKLGTGYAIRSESAGSFSATFTGKINEGGIDVTTYFNTNVISTDPGNVWSTEGDNLVGNPYSSAIDWDIVIQDEDNSHLEGTFYIWDQNTAEVGDNNVSDYLQYNLTGGGSNTTTSKITSMQGFFVRSLTGGTLKFKPTHQIAANNDQFFRNVSSSVTERNDKKKGRSWFSLRKENTYSSMLIGFLKGATDSYDRLYDAPYDINNETLGLYSLIDENKKASIQGLPELKRNSRVVNLGFVVDQVGKYSIQLDEEHIDQDYYIYLVDNLKGKAVDMRRGSYGFTSDVTGENETRFQLVYTKKKKENLEGANEITLEDFYDEDDLVAYVNVNRELKVEFDNVVDKISDLVLYTISGQRVIQFKASENTSVANLSIGVYILETKLASGRVIIKKIMIN
ncbi:MAG: hypothetical protein JXR05_07645 [Flavobacteriaceae bacterium]